MVVLDASFLIDLDRGLEAATAAMEAMVDSGDPMRVPAQAAAEYLAGFDDPVANLRDLEQSYVVVGYDRTHILETARTARESIAAGTFPGWTDAQVAATAVLSGEPIATGDPDHFRALGCVVWDYRRDAGPPGGADDG